MHSRRMRRVGPQNTELSAAVSALLGLEVHERSSWLTSASPAVIWLSGKGVARPSGTKRVPVRDPLKAGVYIHDTRPWYCLESGVCECEGVMMAALLS